MAVKKPDQSPSGVSGMGMNSTLQQRHRRSQSHSRRLSIVSPPTHRSPAASKPPDGPKEGGMNADNKYKGSRLVFEKQKQGQLVYDPAVAKPLPTSSRPSATEGVVYGVSRPVVLDDTAYVPTRPISLLSFLGEDPPEPVSSEPSTKEKFSRKACQAKALLKNPKADPNYPHLPRGANNRICPNKDPFKDRFQRFIKPNTSANSSKASDHPNKQASAERRPTERVPAPQLQLAKEAKFKPAPQRFIPYIEPSKKLTPGPLLDEFLNPFGGEFEAFHQTPVERAKRIKEVNRENEWRNCSDKVLSLQGRQHLRDPHIGRAPPLSKRQLIEPLKRQASRARKDQRDSPKVPSQPSIPDVHPRDIVPTTQDRPFKWDRAFSDTKAGAKYPGFPTQDPVVVYTLTAPSPSCGIPPPPQLPPPPQQPPATSSFASLLEAKLLDLQQAIPQQPPTFSSKHINHFPRRHSEQEEAPQQPTEDPKRIRDRNNQQSGSDKSNIKVHDLESRQPTPFYPTQKLPSVLQKYGSPLLKQPSEQGFKQPEGRWNELLLIQPASRMEAGQEAFQRNVCRNLQESPVIVPPAFPPTQKGKIRQQQYQRPSPQLGQTPQYRRDFRPNPSPTDGPFIGPLEPPYRDIWNQSRAVSQSDGSFPTNSYPGPRPQGRPIDTRERFLQRIPGDQGFFPSGQEAFLQPPSYRPSNNPAVATVDTTEENPDIKRPGVVKDFNRKRPYWTPGQNQPNQQAHDDRTPGPGFVPPTASQRQEFAEEISPVLVARNGDLSRLVQDNGLCTVLSDRDREWQGLPLYPHSQLRASPQEAQRSSEGGVSLERCAGGKRLGKYSQDNSRLSNASKHCQGIEPSKEHTSSVKSVDNSLKAKSKAIWNKIRGRKEEKAAGVNDPEAARERAARLGRNPLDVRLQALQDSLKPVRPNISSGSIALTEDNTTAYTSTNYSQSEELSAPPPIPAKSPYRRLRAQGNLVSQTRSPQTRSPPQTGALYNKGKGGTEYIVVDDRSLPSSSAAKRPVVIPSQGQEPQPLISSAAYRTAHATQGQRLREPTTRVSDLINYPLASASASSSDFVPAFAYTPAVTVSSGSTPPGRSRTASGNNNSKVFKGRFTRMDKLQVRTAEFSTVKAKAIEDARQMQATVIELANKTGQDPPKYALLELIGKGSFGRVYKGKDMTSAAIVAVKIIDIDESDTLNPRNANSYSEFLKEVNALKILSENKARNINHVVEALPVGQSMWMITEYCGGGSIATLMKPTAPGGLLERWIVPILREVAEAIKWVHQAGIIHRDIKCANVLITEEGSVQLCDFGVAGIIESKVDKRSTVIGTPHWMAPELFDATPSYGKEVDIWAFGAMVFEMATGLPPNGATGIPFERLGSHLKHHVPRLEGGSYSNELRNLVAYCLEELPSARPTIEQVQKHPYIHNTSSSRPASDLSALVRAFKVWEDHGGSRRSLFMIGGAQGPSDSSPSGGGYDYDDEWNFSTTAAFDKEVLRDANTQDVYEAYGNQVLGFPEETSRPTQQKASRRRPPPEALARLPAPLEKIFDPNTLSNYEDNSRSHYGRVVPPPASDLPLRDDTAQTSIRDTMIDLGGHDTETGLSSFPDMDTIKASRKGTQETEDDYNSTLHGFSRPTFSESTDNNNRRTQDWKFPSMAPPTSADPEISRFPNSYELPRPTVTPGSGGRPTLVHHPTEPLGRFGGMLSSSNDMMERISMRESLIDLDMSLPDIVPELSRPSTANSDIGSTASEMSSGNPFDLERHASLYQPRPAEQPEPSIYVVEDSVPRSHAGNPVQELADMSDFSASDIESSTRNGNHNHHQPNFDGGHDTASDSDYLSMLPPSSPNNATSTLPSNQTYTMANFPELPPPPSAEVLAGTASREEMKTEMLRQLAGMTEQLEGFRDVYAQQSTGQNQRRGQQGVRRGGRNGAGAGAGTNGSAAQQ